MSLYKFIILNGIWLLLIGGLFGLKQWTLWMGTEVLLQTQPVDPRDLFRGDYVILNYDLSNFASIPTHPDYVNYEFESGDKVYVSLEQDTNGITKARYKMPVKPESGLFLKGVKEYGNVIEYGIESYFVPEGEGLALESVRGDRMQAKVVIGKNGEAVLTGLVVDGEEVVN